MSKKFFYVAALLAGLVFTGTSCADDKGDNLSLIHISEPTRLS